MDVGTSQPFDILLTDGANDDLSWFTPYAQRIILDGIDVHLRHQPTLGSRRIIEMRPNPVAGWELRLGDYRILYDVNDVERTVTILAIGEKSGNRLLIRGEEFTEHEGH
jgi:mRNA-degrading endonuclease RelE of RelBE toxin-antitoxin system